MMKLDYTTFEV